MIVQLVLSLIKFEYLVSHLLHALLYRRSFYKNSNQDRKDQEILKITNLQDPQDKGF